ncbi:OTU domain-containing protein [Glycine max]|nr:OTU domain-containing protein [Glycine max]
MGVRNSRLFLPRGGHSPALKKLERFSVQKVTGDGWCLFRSLVSSLEWLTIREQVSINVRREKMQIDELRMAVKEAICENEGERKLYEEALIAITVDEPLKRYCQRIVRPDFWGGESELLHLGGGFGSGFIPIADYGSEFRKGSSRKAVRLLYSGKNHYDLLL